MGLGAVVALLAVAVAVLGVRAHANGARAHARVAALAAAAAAAGDILAYDYQHLNENFARARQHVAPGSDFAKEYDKTTQTVIAPAATANQVRVTAKVIASGVKTATSDSAVVIVFVDQTTMNAKIPAPRTDQNRVRMTLARQRGQWLVTKIDAL